MKGNRVDLMLLGRISLLYDGGASRRDARSLLWTPKFLSTGRDASPIYMWIRRQKDAEHGVKCVASDGKTDEVMTKPHETLVLTS